MTDIRVELNERSYSVHVAAGLLGQLGQLCRDAGLQDRVTIITGEPLWATHGHDARKSLRAAGFGVEHILVPDGEDAKALSEIRVIYDALADVQHERGHAIIALGGGTVGDAAGFAAATYLRGVPLVQVPTTLLAQVDSAIGGKTGINLKLGKNLVGAFWQPQFVACDTDLLSTLSTRAIASGLAEVIKYACIAEPEILTEVDRDLEAMQNHPPRVNPGLVARCARIKARIVSQDEREGDQRRILNFGHTYGHALESASGYEDMMHGEAVALGMLVALELSVMATGLDTGAVERVYGVLKRTFPELDFPKLPFHKLAALMAVDKKVSRGRQICVLINALGEPVVQDLGSLDRMEQAAETARKRWHST